MNMVAERAGLSQQMVSYVEREMRNPTLETLLRIAAHWKLIWVSVLKRASNSNQDRQRNKAFRVKMKQ